MNPHKRKQFNGTNDLLFDANRLKCGHCEYWGNGTGTGAHYDAGPMNVCTHKQNYGDQHPSYGAYGDTTTMIYAGVKEQHLMTRYTFGCILFKEIVK